MAKIQIDHRHRLTQEQAREKMRELAKQLEEKYRLKLVWKQDAVEISGTGVKGDLTWTPGRIAGELDVPFFVKGRVEKALGERLQKDFPV